MKDIFTSYKMEDIKFSFRIETIGLTNVGDYKNVVCEIKYAFKGRVGKIAKERSFIQPIDYSNLNSDTFIDSDKILMENLEQWLESSIPEEDLNSMKQTIFELFNPKIIFVKDEFFKKNSHTSYDEPEHRAEEEKQAWKKPQ